MSFINQGAGLAGTYPFYVDSMAGYETTSQTVCYGLLELACNPKIQSRLREECLEFLGEPSYDAMNTKLPYLDAVLKEVSVAQFKCSKKFESHYHTPFRTSQTKTASRGANS